MLGAMMFKQTQTPFDVPGNWPCVEGGGWLSSLASYAGATVIALRRNALVCLFHF